MESTGIAVGASTVVRYMVDVRYQECPLMEVPSYTSSKNCDISQKLLDF